MHRLMVVAALLLIAGYGEAQEPADLLGKWDFEIEGDDDPRCGARKTVGQMDVTKKITARAYRGATTTQSVTERCGVVGRGESGFTLRVKEGNVTIEYDEGWSSDSLRFEGSTMTGFDSEGTPMTFAKVVERPVERTEADIAKLDEFLERLAPEFSTELRAEFGQNMLQNLRRTGLSRDESIQVATQTIDRMTDCIIDIARDEIITQSLPIDEILADTNATILLQPQNIDYREIECVHEAAQNAGVVIR